MLQLWFKFREGGESLVLMILSSLCINVDGDVDESDVKGVGIDL